MTSPGSTWQSECKRVTLYCGDCLSVLRDMPDTSVNCCVTSPPYYGLRDYGYGGQIGLEESPQAYVDKLVSVFREIRRVLRDDGTLWLNLGDSYNGSQKGSGGTGVLSAKQNSNKGANYAVGKTPLKMNIEGLKPKDLIGIPWRVAFALQADGWYLRQDIIWHKPNPMPESVKDRCTKAHEYIFLMSKSARYWYDGKAISEESTYAPGCGWDDAKRGYFNGKTEALKGRNAFRSIKDTRNRRSVWTVTTRPYPEAHFAVFPPELITPCILAGCPQDGIVLDPFAGSGTTLAVAIKNSRRSIGIELNQEYCELVKKRVYPILAQPSLFEATPT